MQHIFHRYRPQILFTLFVVFYCGCFILFERRDAAIEVNIIHSELDTYIPYCKYFVIPYLLWYPYLAIIFIDLGYIKKNNEEFSKLALNSSIGMSIFILISLTFPNGHNLRPVIVENDIFSLAMKVIHYLDTSTNILPSLHVYLTVTALIAVLNNRECGNRKWIKYGSVILSALIILSTVFIKQHSAIDGMFAIMINLVSYLAIYDPGTKSLKTKKEKEI